jgi:hypothetical protein
MRVTRADLESKVADLARITGRELRVSGAYGGFTVEDSKTGANVISHGHIKAAELSIRIAVYVDGYCQGKEDWR